MTSLSRGEGVFLMIAAEPGSVGTTPINEACLQFEAEPILDEQSPCQVIEAEREVAALLRLSTGW